MDFFVHRSFKAISATLSAIAIASTVSCSRTAVTTHQRSPQNDRTTETRQVEKLRDEARFLRRDGSSFRDSDDTVRPYDVTSYNLKGTYDWQGQLLRASVAILLTLKDTTANAIQLDASVTDIAGVLLNEQPNGFQFDRGNGLVSVDISALSQAARSEPITLSIRYTTSSNARGHLIGRFSPAALRAVEPRRGDPVAIRTLNTMSEPQAASQWMPCNDDPADRATFAAEFHVAPEETFISNGDLVRDELTSSGERIMGYQTTYSIPTYLMAFAQGTFTKAETRVGSLPVAVYARRGLPVDLNGILRETTRTMSRFQEILGPFPFEKYAIIFLPEFGGGEEHAGITFQTEMWGTDPDNGGDRSMIAHEMAHQWFGDYMTVETWDDLWIKEGMATLLESESGRPYTDENRTGRLFGSQFEAVDGEAVIDPQIPPSGKYNSGPYGRAAWVHTQIRAQLQTSCSSAKCAKFSARMHTGTLRPKHSLQHWPPILVPTSPLACGRRLLPKKFQH